MVKDVLLASALLALSVVIHAVVLNYLLRWLSRRSGMGHAGFWRSTWLLVGVAFRLVGSHLLQILCWGGFYAYEGVFADLRSATYFSIVTYTTVGYGDLVPPVPWRWAAGIEGLTGILMCGWSTAFFFTIVSKLYAPPGAEPSS